MATASNLIGTIHPERSRWVQRLGRAGFAAKGVVYCLIGLFAAQAALGEGGHVGGAPEAVHSVGQQPFGQLLLILIGVGLLGYALWRLIDVAVDARGQGSSGVGLIKRFGDGVGALMNGGLAVIALELSSGKRRAPSGEPDTFVGRLLVQPFGEVLVAALGLSAVVVGVLQIRHGYKKAFMGELDVSRLSRGQQTFVERAGMIGLMARGVVFGVIGVFLIKAAIEHRPGSAVGVGGALRTIASQPWGLVLLLMVAIGLMAYGAFQIVTARYARLPAH